MNSKFGKYKDSGAYHWVKTHDVPTLWRGVRLLARYDLVAGKVRKLVRRPARGLDVGCGDGFLIYRLDELGYSTVGLDACNEGLVHAAERLRAKGINTPLIEGSAYQLPADNDTLAFVTLVEVIEHLDKPHVALHEVYRVLEPGGIFVCTTPQRAPDQRVDEVRDPYHIKEYVEAELFDELSIVFDGVDVYGAYPETLDGLYRPGHKGGLVTKAIRLVFRLAAELGMNPYLKCSNPASSTDQLLVGVARKSS